MDQTDRVNIDHANPWKTASAIQHLAEATADFLEGRLSGTPSHPGKPDAETIVLISTLTAINRAGLVTVGSQPGHNKLPGHSMQRAYLCAFGDETIVAKMSTALIDTELVCLIIPPGAEGDGSIVVTVGDGEPFTYLGRYGPDKIDFHCNGMPSLDAALNNAWQVQIFYPVWGRNEVLWRTVSQSLQA